MKVLKLKRKWVFVLGILTTFAFQALITDFETRYRDYLQECDKIKGYTCNIFGQ